jgi:hypothetical protein
VQHDRAKTFLDKLVKPTCNLYLVCLDAILHLVNLDFNIQDLHIVLYSARDFNPQAAFAK